MRYYLAALFHNGHHFLADNAELLTQERPYFLDSFYYYETDKNTRRNFDAYYTDLQDRFMLDSGAFSFINQARAVVPDIDAFTDRYIDFVRAFNPPYFFEMDVDLVYGVDKALQLRRRIEDETGRRPIPVWHAPRGAAAFIRDCRDYDYVAIGSPLMRDHNRKTIISLFPWFVSTAHKHGARIHALGLSMLDVLLTSRFDSCDSTAWVKQGAYGKVARFNGRGISLIGSAEYRTERTAVVPHNLREYIKLQKYLETVNARL